MPATDPPTTPPTTPPSTSTDVAVIGAAGACGRQVALQLLDRALLSPDARLQLVGHHGGASSHELFGLRADLRDAFADDAPAIELVDDPAGIDADVVVMIAGATLPTAVGANVDRARLAATNRAMFEQYATALGARTDRTPLVIVQSNPVELGVAVFSRHLDRHRVVGAGAWSDTLRFRREIADSLGVRRSAVHATMIGQHGDHLVPLWSRIRVDGIDEAPVAAWCTGQRRDRTLDRLPAEIVAEKTRLLAMVGDGDVAGAFAAVAALPADVRAAVKPFLVHFTAGHTTEIVTAHSVVELVALATGADPGRSDAATGAGADELRPLQVRLTNEVDDLTGVLGVPVAFGPDGWRWAGTPTLAPDEMAALRTAAGAIAEATA